MPKSKAVRAAEERLAKISADAGDRTRRDAVRRDQLIETTPRFDPLARPALTIPLTGSADGLRIAVLPDGQNGPGRPWEHWQWAGKYVAGKRPDVLVNLGDMWDFGSLSTHDNKGTLIKEGSRYQSDLDAGKRAQDAFDNEIEKAPGYDPLRVFLKGNHEDREDRYLNQNPELEGALPGIDEYLKGNGWSVLPYLQPVIIGGIAFCHYFPSGVRGQAISDPAKLLTTQHMSAIAGHLQGRQIAFGKRADGVDMTAIISGSFYQHDEHYLSPAANIHWRGMWMLHEVIDGSFDEMAISIKFLKRKFG